MSRSIFLAVTGAALAIGTLASTSASAGFRSIGIRITNIQVPQTATSHSVGLGQCDLCPDILIRPAATRIIKLGHPVFPPR
jgi:hypothetical protein